MNKIILSALITIVVTGIISTIELSDNNFNKPPQIPNEWFYKQRAFPFEQINHEAYVNAQMQADALRKESRFKTGTGIWEFAGPLNIGGRITDVEMHPSDLNTIYIGAASGGVFKSPDKGNTWTPIFDDAMSLSIGDIALAPSNPDIIYVGTGEANSGGGSLAYDGVGIYKSTDAGENWDYIGLENSRNIGRMVVHPNNPDVLYVAAMGNLFSNSEERGVYKTIDGGQNWEQMLYVSDSTGAIDIAIHPTNPDTIYAAMWERVRRPNRNSFGGLTCGIYRSYDGGNSWQQLTNGLPSLPTQKGRIGIDISDSDPNILYAIYADRVGFFNGVYKTEDSGDTWTQTNDQNLSGSYASYGWWFGRIKVDPVNPDNAFVIGLDIYRTQNGGNSWANQSGSGVHVDQHAVYIHPLNNDFVLLGNDGGLNISQNGGNTWAYINVLPITQFYTCEVDYQNPERLYGGTQDNGTNRTLTGGLDNWHAIFGGDGFYVLVDPVNHYYVYAESQYGNLGRSTNSGNSFSSATSGINGSDRFNWNCPVVFDPSDPSVLYFGSNKLYKSTDRAISWDAISGDLTSGPGEGNLAFNTLTTISISPVDVDIIYTGSDDGNVNVSLDGGLSWENISAGLPERWITRVATDPLESNVVYVTISGYRWDEYIPHIFKSEDNGQSWMYISANLPEAPVNDIIINTPNNQTLFVATDMGVYVSYDGGNEWSILGGNLPNVVVNDLVIHKPTNKLIAGTYGRSMYHYDLEQDPVTSVNDSFSNTEISIYPNPFKENILISLSVGNFANFTIIDLSGRTVKSFSTSAKAISWDGKNDNGKNLPAGIYFCIIQNKGEFITKKIIKR